MNRRPLVIVFVGLALLATVGLVVILRRQPPEPPPAAAKAETRPAPPPGRSTPKVEAPAMEPPRRAASRGPERKSELTPAPAPAPVEAAPDAGILRIESDVPGALVFIDREYVGVTPVTAPNVRPGTHRLNVSVEGYDPIANTIDVAPGPRNIQIRLKEVRLDLTVDVVHKHRMGSCRGRLIATPQGLRYETTNKNDAFSAALLDLDTWQVDYLEKNLRVSVRNGKRYDFTDPAANADRLFVFHRDVEKARERLEKGDPPAKE